MASRHSIDTPAHTYVATRMYPRSGNMSMTGRSGFFPPLKLWKLVPCYLLFLALYKIFSMRQCFWVLLVFRIWSTTVSNEGKVKTGRLQSVIGHVATPPQGVGSAWGKDLAPPERPGVRPDRAVPGTETDTQRPPLPSTSALGSVIQLLQTTPFCFAAHFSDASLSQSPHPPPIP